MSLLFANIFPIASQLLTKLIIGIFNPLNNLGSDYPSINILTGTISTGRINIENLSFGNFFLNYLSISALLHISILTGKFYLKIEDLTIDIEASKYGIDYWRNSFHKIDSLESDLKSNESKSHIKSWINKLFGLFRSAEVILQKIQVIINQEIELNLNSIHGKVAIARKEIKAELKSESIALNIPLVSDSSSHPVIALTGLHTTIIKNDSINIDMELGQIALDTNAQSHDIFLEYLGLYANSRFYQVNAWKDHFDHNLQSFLKKFNDTSHIIMDDDSISLLDESFYLDTQPKTHIPKFSYHIKTKLKSFIVISQISHPNNPLEFEVLAFKGLIMNTIHHVFPNASHSLPNVILNTSSLSCSVNSYASEFLLPNQALSAFSQFEEENQPAININFESQQSTTESIHRLTQSNEFSMNLLPFVVSMHSQSLGHILSVLKGYQSFFKIFSSTNYTFQNNINQNINHSNPKAIDYNWKQCFVNVLEFDFILKNDSLHGQFNDKQANAIKLTIPNFTIGLMATDYFKLSFPIINISSININDPNVMSSTLLQLDEVNLLIPCEKNHITMDFVTRDMTHQDFDWEIAKKQYDILDVGIKKCSVHLSNDNIHLLNDILFDCTSQSIPCFLPPPKSNNHWKLFHVAPLQVSGVRFCIGSLEFKLAIELTKMSKLFYKFLISESILFESVSINNYWSSNSLIGTKSFIIEIETETTPLDSSEVLKSSKALVIVQPIHLDTEKESNCLIFKSKTFFSEICWHSQEAYGLGYLCKNTHLSFDPISIVFDLEDILPLLHLIRDTKDTNYLSMQYFNSIQHYHKEKFEAIKRIDLNLRNNFNLYKHPTSVQLISIPNFRLTCLHLQKPVFVFSLQTIEYASVSFSENLTQSSCSASSLIVSELTCDRIVHKTIIDNIDPKNPQLSNKILFHMSKKKGDYGLLEIHAENLRVIYLQRATMTLVSYIRDYLIAGLNKGLEPNFIPKRLGDFIRYPGMYRFSAVIRKSEVHLPNNSSATDALVILFHHGHVYRTNDQINSLQLTKSYAVGPFLYKRIWMSELPNVKKQIQIIFADVTSKNNISGDNNEDEEDDQDTSLITLNWKLPFQYKELESKIDLPSIPNDQSYIWVELFDAAISSWRNKNSVCTQQDISCRILMFNANGKSEEADEVYQGDVYQIASSEIRNTIVVDVYADSIEWNLSQGQYWTIVHLIQQNFMENQELVEDIYVLPTPKLVDVHENVYGRYMLDELLPTISSIPIHITKGKIIAIENDPEYYDSFNLPIPEPVVLHEKDFHNHEETLDSTIPVDSHSHSIKNQTFSRWSMKRSTQATFSKGVSFSSSTSYLKEEKYEIPFAIIFEKLEVDFYRKHFGGGNGIEVTADTFMVVTGEDMSNDDEMSSHDSLDLDDLDVRNAVLAPISHSLFHSSHHSQTPSNENKKKSEKRPKSSSQTPIGSSSSYNTNYSNPPTKKNHLRYSQQGMGNLRRCVIYVEDTAVIIHFLTIMAIVDFFHTPIRVIYDRNCKMIEYLGQGPYDFKIALDVELHITNSVLCLPDTKNKEEANAFCFALNLTYTHAWRGFLLCGPGSAVIDILSIIHSTFVAPLNEIQMTMTPPSLVTGTSNVRSLVDSVRIHFTNLFYVFPHEEVAERNKELLLPWLHFDSDWYLKKSKFNRSSGTRIMKLLICPIKTDSFTNEDVMNPEEDDDVGDVDESNGDEVPESTSGKENIPEEDSTPMNSTKSKTIPITSLLVRGQCSLKDMEFILKCIISLRKSISLKIERAPKQDPYIDISQSIQDLHHLPTLAYYLVHTTYPTDRQTKILKVDSKELQGNICSFEFIIRNNTYNLNICKTNLQDICMVYTRSPDHLHMAAGVKLDVSTFNDLIDEWEPIIEPIYLRAIGATDASKGSTFSVSTASKIRVEVYTEPLEINASILALDNLIHKIRLADVVTTSSQRLPPYKIINELGVPVKFHIGLNGGIVINNEVKIGCSVPIEVNQLAEAINNYKLRKQYATNSDTSFANSAFSPSDHGNHTKEYLMYISFSNLRDHYESKIPLSIDKVGITPFEMIEMANPEEKNKQQRHSLILPAGISSEMTDEERNSIIQLAMNAQETQETNIQQSVITNAFESHISSNVLSTQNLKFFKEIPLTILEMKIKDDGIRELHLKSILTIKNTTHRVMQIALHLYGSSCEYSLAPGKDWNVPVRFANPKAALFLRFDMRSGWFEALPCLANFIVSGYWGAPQKLKAEVCMCPSEISDNNSGMNDSKWVLLLKPEAKVIRGVNSSKNSIPLRYPTRDSYRKSSQQQGIVEANEFGGIDELPSSHLSTVTNNLSSIKTQVTGIRPLCIYLQAPMQLSNLLPQAILYRLADIEGNVCGNGMILPGQIIDIHRLFPIFQSKIVISIRLINYGWSKWTVIYNRSTPFSTSERSLDISLPSLNLLSANEKSFFLPPLDITLSIKEFLVRFTSQLIICNNTGIDLNIAEASNLESYIPVSSSHSVKDFVDEEGVNKSLIFIKSQMKSRKQYLELTAEDDDSSNEEDQDESTEQSLSSGLNGNSETSSNNPPPISGKVQEENTGASLRPMIIRLPQDHCKQIEILASTSWTLNDLFHQLRQRLSSVLPLSDPRYYIFFPYIHEAGSKAVVSDIVENDESTASTSSTTQTPASNTASIPTTSTTTSENKNVTETLKEDPSPRKNSTAPIVTPTPAAAIPSGAEIPPFMRFDMIFDLNCESYLLTQKIDTLPSNQLVLVHLIEYQIYLQATNLTSKIVEKEGLFRSVFGKTKFIHFAKLYRLEGEIPFRPRKVLGFNPNVSICVPNETDWSPGIDFVKGDFDVGEMTIRIVAGETRSKKSNPLEVNIIYEFGAFIERGRGILQNASVITLVPKHILVSKLSFPLQIIQGMESGNHKIHDLPSKCSKSFFFHTNIKSKLLQLRQSEESSEKDVNSPIIKSWCGEFDICTLGIVYVRIKDPMTIIKIETELVGASFVSTFKEQNLLWPPYKIVNNTNLQIRIRQIVTPSQEKDIQLSSDNLVDKSISTSASNLEDINRERTESSSSSKDNIKLEQVKSNNKSSNKLCWETLSPKTFLPYTWEYPLTGKKLLQIEVSEDNNNWNSKEISLDDDSKTQTLIIKKLVPNLGNPLAEGHLMKSEGNNENWNKVYCILRPDVMYIYEDETRQNLVSILNFAMLINETAKFASVTRFNDKGRDIFSTLFGAGNSNASTNKSTLDDINNIRFIILRVADHLGLFAHCTPATFEVNAKRRRRSSSFNTMDRSSDENDDDRIGFSLEVEDRGVVDIQDLELVKTLSDQLLENPILPIDNEDRKEQSELIEPKEEVPIKMYTLNELLAANISVEQLLEEIENAPLRIGDVINALVESKQADSRDKAIELCQFLITEKILAEHSNHSQITGFGADSSSTHGDQSKYQPSILAEEELLASSPSFVNLPSTSVPLAREKSVNPSTPSWNPANKIRGNLTSYRSNKKLESWLLEYEFVDLFFLPPKLNIELLAGVEEMTNSSEPRMSFSINSNIQPINGEEVFGFTITLQNQSKIHFKCASEMEFWGWIQACRASIERSWVDVELGRNRLIPLVLEDFQSNIILKIKPDGSTKVLSILESEVQKNPLVSLLRGKPSSFSKIVKATAIIPLFGKGRNFLRGKNTSFQNEEGNDAYDRDQQLINVSFAVESVSLSLIDSTPLEILYLRLQDIEMSVIRYYDAVQFSVTVHTIQLCDQLLRPSFPVTLFPRKIKEVAGKRLMLPGLNPDSKRQGYPTLHLYLQQRYHQEISVDKDDEEDYPENSQSSTIKRKKHDAKLWYFDIFTLWLAPLQIAVDEEIIVRTFRFAQSLRSFINREDSNHKSVRKLKEDAFGLQGYRFLSGELDHLSVYELYSEFISSGRKPYHNFVNNTKTALNLYFNLLQLHPLDITLSFRASPEVQITNAELALISVISQLNSARLCLNALVAEHAYGSTAIISEIIVKHYRAAFWRQFHKLLGTSDLVDGSVGLVANLGTGVYDLFYEPIDGLLDENAGLINSISKNSMNLASRAIGGTSAAASKITGGIGKGVSLLTLDTEFQRHRNYRRFNKASTVSEGLYVGTQELGKNIVEGVTGIVVSPYRGWETGGGVGFGYGVAKGILGVALKPAVGVFDLASRATEGLRNSAFNSETGIKYEMQGVYRSRIPRAFGRLGLLMAYDPYAAAAQYMIDSLTDFKYEPRIHVISHLYNSRKIPMNSTYNALFVQSRSRLSITKDSGTFDELVLPSTEAWGLKKDNHYMVLVSSDRIALLQIFHDTPNNPSSTASKGKKKQLNRKFIWTCPATCINQLASDSRGDLLLNINTSLAISGTWNNIYPTVLDLESQNFIILQSLLEQTLGTRYSHQHPLTPVAGPLQSGIRKRYSSGIRSFLLSPTSHTYRLCGNCLYEYTRKNIKNPEKKTSSNTDEKIDEGNETKVSEPSSLEEINSEEDFMETVISRLFPDLLKPQRQHSVSSENTHSDVNIPSNDFIDPELKDCYLSFIYPLVDLYMVGPTPEDNNKLFSITIARVDKQKMRVLKRDDDNDLFTEYLKINLSLLFDTMDDALHWRHLIESRILFRTQEDCIPVAPLTSEEKRKQFRSPLNLISSSNNSNIGNSIPSGVPSDPLPSPPENSILGQLVLPTAGLDPIETERIKIEIAKTLTLLRR